LTEQSQAELDAGHRGKRVAAGGIMDRGGIMGSAAGIIMADGAGIFGGAVLDIHGHVIY
jgi:hypothetical protein